MNTTTKIDTPEQPSWWRKFHLDVTVKVTLNSGFVALVLWWFMR